MNFNQWKGYAAKGDVSKITYLCGNQEALVEIVVEDIKTLLNVPATDLVYVTATDDTVVWELASQYPLDPAANRLVLVRNADRIEDWSGLSEWLANSRSNPKNFLLFVADTDDAPAIFVKGKKAGYSEHIELIRTKGKFIRCSTPNEEDLVSWAQSYGLSAPSAKFLVERTSADTSAMLNVLRKVKVWNGSPNDKALSLLCDEQVTDSFSDYLIMKNKRAAFLALSNMSQEDRLRALSQLDYKLNYLYEIGSCVSRRMYDVDIASTTGIKIFLVKKYKPIVKEYDGKKIKQCRQLLAMTDSHLRQGAKVGVMESLVALW